MRRTFAILAATFATTATAWAAGEPEFNLVLEGHKFKPDRIEVPAGRKVKFLVENRDATPAEFESDTLKVEKVIPGKGKVTVFVGPLKPGEYTFYDDYNQKTATGVVVSK